MSPQRFFFLHLSISLVFLSACKDSVNPNSRPSVSEVRFFECTPTEINPYFDCRTPTQEYFHVDSVPWGEPFVATFEVLWSTATYFVFVSNSCLESSDINLDCPSAVAITPELREHATITLTLFLNGEFPLTLVVTPTSLLADTVRSYTLWQHTWYPPNSSPAGGQGPNKGIHAPFIEVIE